MWFVLSLPLSVQVLPDYERGHGLAGPCPCRPRVEMRDTYSVPLIVHRDLAEREGLGPDAWRWA